MAGTVSNIRDTDVKYLHTTFALMQVTLSSNEKIGALMGEKKFRVLKEQRARA